MDQTTVAPGRAVAVGRSSPEGERVQRLWESGTGGREAQEEDGHVWGRAVAGQENRRHPDFKMGGKSGLGWRRGREERAVLP